jgi:glyoxylase-like metal-dependent hydrolase (beta-lactamase superfamily II)
MKLSTIIAGYLKLDGGAMFGIVPKRLWARTNPPDANNLCTWAMRCLLVEHQGRNILVDTGIGTKQDERFRAHFEPTGQELLAASLADHGLAPTDITDVLLTHLHFDHVGGALERSDKGEARPTFPNAVYWTNQAQWRWAMRPNPREAASFLPENLLPLQELGLLRFIPVEQNFEWLPGFRLEFVYGHTEAMMLPKIQVNGRTLVYCADLIPSSSHLGLPYVMGYDIRPLDTIREKERVLELAAEAGHILFFEHDPLVECATVTKDKRGKFVVAEQGKLADLLG